MRIAVNGKSFGERHPGGAVRVARTLLEHVAAARPDWRFDLLLPAGADSAGGAWPANVRCRALGPPAASRGSYGRSLWEQLVLPSAIRRDGGYAALLNLTNSAPAWLSPSVPQLLLLHDAGFVNDAWISGAYSRYLRSIVRAARRRGVRLVTVSATSADELRRAFPGLGAIEVVHNGVSVPPGPYGPAPVPGPYVLYLGSINPRKNLAGAIAGYEAFRRRTSAAEWLVVAGAEKAIFRRQGLPAGDDVLFLGYVDDATKWRLLAHARALLLPSFLEGFGLPVLEAIGVGTPAVVSDIPVFRELFEGAAEFVDPHSPDDIARGLAAALRGAPPPAEPLLRRFDWRTAASRYVELIETLPGGRMQ
jgi:glycosyltransferase involved in cell wall biosynthesis